MITIAEIESIRECCMRLLTCTEYLRRDETSKELYDSTKSIIGSVRKLFIASMMYNKKLICISGLQGAGKTTLMRNFYQLNDQFLDPTRGRGERIPVLITEKKGLQTPILYAVRIEKGADGKYYRREDELSSEEYISATNGEDTNTMYLELFVPYMHTYYEGISFMLLPGFEKKNDYLNNLIEFSVNSSDVAVFVFNETSFSNAENDKYVKIIQEKFGENLVYVISGSDGSPDYNEEVKQTCMNTLNIPAIEKDRVVCTGCYADEKKNLEWIEQFKLALEKYAYRENQNFQNQKNNTYLYEIVLKIKESLYKILSTLNQDNSAEIVEHRNDTLLKYFDKVVEKKKKEFEEQLNTEFEKAKVESVEKLERMFDEQPKTRYVRSLFFGPTVKEQYTESREMIQKCLQDDDNCYLADKYFGLALRNSLRQWDQNDKINVRTDIKRLIDTKKKDGKTLLLVDGEKTQAMAGDICNLLADHSERQINYALQSKDPKKVMGAVVQIGTYYYNLISYDMVAERTGLRYYEPAQTELIPDTMIEGARSSKKFVAGMAGMMGIDLIGDGSINMVSQIATSLGLAAPVAGAAAVAIIGAGALSVVMKDLNRMQREDFQSAHLAVKTIYDDLKKEALKKFDEYVSVIRDRIEENLTEISGDGKKVIAEYNAKVEVNNLLNILDEISKRHVGELNGLESFFS